jgi:hypothetical protein
MLGFLVGAVLFGLTYPAVFPVISKVANYGSKTIPGLWNINLWLTVIFFAEFVFFTFYLLARVIKLRQDKLA